MKFEPTHLNKEEPVKKKYYAYLGAPAFMSSLSIIFSDKDNEVQDNKYFGYGPRLPQFDVEV